MNEDNLTLDPSASSPPPERLVARLVALGMLLGLAHYWAARHWDIQLLKMFEEQPLLLILVPWLAALMEFVGGDKAKGGVLSGLRKVASAVVRPAVLTVLGLTFLLFASVFSSVTVVPEGASVPLTVTLSSPNGRATNQDTRILFSSSELTRFGRWTNPFGRTFVLEADAPD